MFDAYGRAFVEERRRPHHPDGLATYVGLEYPRGTDPLYFLAEVGRGRPQGKRRGDHPGRVLKALPRIMGALLHRRQPSRRTESERSWS